MYIILYNDTDKVVPEKDAHRMKRQRVPLIPNELRYKNKLKHITNDLWGAQVPTFRKTQAVSKATHPDFTRDSQSYVLALLLHDIKSQPEHQSIASSPSLLIPLVSTLFCFFGLLVEMSFGIPKVANRLMVTVIYNMAGIQPMGHVHQKKRTTLVQPRKMAFRCKEPNLGLVLGDLCAPEANGAHETQETIKIKCMNQGLQPDWFMGKTLPNKPFTDCSYRQGGSY